MIDYLNFEVGECKVKIINKKENILRYYNDLDKNLKIYEGKEWHKTN